MPILHNLTVKPIDKKKEIFIVILIIAILSLVYLQIQNHAFINYDDDKFVTNNIYIQSGITLDGIRWAFEKGWGYWKPLTWLSLMVDYEIYGMNAGGFLMTNLLLHLLNTLLLFLLLKQMTGELLKSGFIAALFAIHPLHVESVAWVAERKDVLSTFFWFSSTWFYVKYTKNRNIYSYLLIILCMGLGLMAKPMLVTLPATLLLLDYWPLQRLRLPKYVTGKKEQPVNPESPQQNNSSILWQVFQLTYEKIPFFLISIVASVSLLSDKAKEGYPILDSAITSSYYLKISTALKAYSVYLVKTVWPFDLAIPYPVADVPLQHTFFAFFFLFSITFVAVIYLKKYPYLAVGWFWYIGTLIPVIGLIKVGSFSMADRFTYVPLVGIFIIFAWGIPDLFRIRARKNIIIPISAVLSILFFSLVARTQVGYWKDTITLFNHTLKITENNYIAHDTLASTLLEQGNVDEALKHYEKVIKIEPTYAGGHNNIGNAYKKLGKVPEAIHHYLEASRLDPKFTDAYYNLGVVFLEKGKHTTAEQYFRKTIEHDPDNFEAYDNLGTALAAQGKVAEAIQHFYSALKINPEFDNALINLAGAFTKKGNTDEAIKNYQKALALNSKRSDVQYNLGILLLKKQKIQNAIQHLREAIRINPEFLEAYVYLGDIFSKTGDINKAIESFYHVISLKPNYVEIHYYLGILFLKQNKIDNAIRHLYHAVSIRPNYNAARAALAHALKTKNTQKTGNKPQ